MIVHEKKLNQIRQDDSNIMTRRHYTDIRLFPENTVTFDNKPGQQYILDDQIPEVEGSNIPEIEEPSPSSSESSKVVIYKGRQGWQNEVWRRAALRIMVYVVKFVTFILTNSEKLKFSFINSVYYHISTQQQKQFHAINDKASNFDFYLNHKIIREKVKEKKKYLNYKLIAQMKDFINYFALKYFRIIDPSSGFKIIWDIFYLIILVIQFSFVPLKICFEIMLTDPGYVFFFNQLPIIMYIMEIVLNFMTGYYEHGTLIMNPMQIIRNYTKKQLLFDCVVCFPFILRIFMTDGLPEIFEIILILKLNRLIQLADNIEEQLYLRQRYSTQVDVSRLLIQFLFIAHLFACAWHYLAIIEDYNGIQNTWLTQQEDPNDPWYQRYVTSIYWSSITTLTIGYGDIHPITYYEKIFVIIVAVISSVVFGYTIANIGQIFSQLNENRKQQRYVMSLVSSYVQQRQVSKNLAIKVKKFYEYLIKLEQSKESDGEQIMNKLSPSLKRELNIDIYQKYLLNSKLFKVTFSKEFIEQVCQLMQERQYTPEENIFVSHQILNEIYFIIKGEVSLSIESGKNDKIIFLDSQVNKESIKTIKKNGVIGERFFITGENTEYSAKTTQFTKIAYINKQNFLELLHKYPEELQRFQESQNKMMMNERIKIQGCELCYQNHKLSKCPFVFYQPNMRKLIKKQDLEKQKRCYKPRFGMKTQNSLRQKQWIQELVITYAIENDLLREESFNDSLLEKFDIKFMDQRENKFVSQQESSDNTLIQHQLPILFHKESQNIVVQEDSNHEKYLIKQSSAQKMKTSIKQENRLKFLLSKKSEANPPNKIVLQDFDQSSSSVQIQRKSLKTQNSNTLEGTRYNIQQGLYQEFLAQFETNDDLYFDKYKEYQNYYPSGNISVVIQNIAEKLLLLKRKKKQKQQRQKGGLKSSSNIGASAQLDGKSEYKTIKFSRRSAQVDFNQDVLRVLTQHP
ncbi:hypothetical protein pb186bvf_015127 [Paramecium bursaria]